VKDTIFLVITPRKVDRMTKTLPDTRHDEIVVKVVVEVPPGRFRTPTVERRIVVEDWTDGTELGDIRLEKDFITEDEAALIVQRRIARMAQILREHGAEVTWPPEGSEQKTEDSDDREG
jgi:hypothetical protein